MQERLEYAISVLYQLAGHPRHQVFLINSMSINDGLTLLDLENSRTNRYFVAGYIAKSEIEYTIPAAKSIEWTGTLIPVSPNICTPSNN